MIDILIPFFAFLIGAAVSAAAYERDRRQARQFRVVKAEAIRLRNQVPSDLWLAIAPYELD
jgi:hypothetical protein